MIEVCMITVLLIGICIAFFDEIKEIFSLIKKKIKKIKKGFIREEIISESEITGEKNIDKICTHVKVLLQVTMGTGTDKGLKVFLIISSILSLFVFTLLVGKISLRLTAASALIMLFFPYCLLRVKLEQLRTDSSREGEVLITELLENYKINYYNMLLAIEMSAKTIEEAPNSKRLLFNLSRGLNRAATAGEIKKLLEEFRLSINTSWANVLTINMFFSLSSGLRVTDALADLSETIARARKVSEFAKRENSEAVLMLRYLAPACYILTVLAGIGFFGLSFDTFLLYQFNTQPGLTWFTISLILYVTGLTINGFLAKGTFDI